MANDLCINLWEIDSSKALSQQQIWSKLKAIEIYETTNILIMLYNACEKESFSRLPEVYEEFKESNTVGAYSILVSVVDPESKKLIKS